MTGSRSRYHDTHRAKVQALIEEKAQGKTIAVATSAPSAKGVVDLMEALSQSIAAQADTAKPKPKKKATATKTPAKKAAEKFTTAKKTAAARPARRKAS